MFTAFGIAVPGSSASVPATPMISVPPKANSTRMKALIMPPAPCGKKPPSAVRFASGFPPPAEPRPNTRIAAPPTIIPITAVTLMSVNTNSSSPNQRTLARFAAPTISRVSATQIHCAVSGNQKRM